MNHVLIRIGGFANAAFVLFHLWLGWRLHHLAQLPPAVRGLLETFNVAGALFIGFFAYVSLRHTQELLTSALGRAVLVLVVSLYAARAASEVLFSPSMNPLIVAASAAMIALYLIPRWRVAGTTTI